MPQKKHLSAPVGGGLNALKNNSTISGCETPNRPYMKAQDNEKKTVYFVRPDCKSWSCKYCAARRAKLWRHIVSYGADCLLKEGIELTFVTLTSHELVRSLVAGLSVWRKAWPKLSAKMRRRTKSMRYIYIPELTKAGSFHAHLITSCTLKTRWFKDNARSVGLGYQAKVVEICTAVECGAYCTKYLTKAMALQDWPKYTRRVNKSQNWPTPPDVESVLAWSTLGNDLLRVKFSISMYTGAGWKISHSLEELGVSQ